MDCSAFDGPCHVGVCQGGGCVTEELACTVDQVRFHVPGGSFGGKTPGGHGARGSAGHGAPVGAHGDQNHTIIYGFQGSLKP